jgi:uncharacterized protein
MSDGQQRWRGSMQLTMQRITIVSKKYDGSVRDEYEAFLYSASDEQLVVFAPPGIRVFDHRKQTWLEAPDGLIELFSLRAWYHVWHICEQVSGTNTTYVHIATPAQYHGTTIEWTDLDLDIRVHLDGSVVVLDEEEFWENAARMGYPPEVVERCRAACAQVLAGLAGTSGEFDREHYVALYAQIAAARA